MKIYYINKNSSKCIFDTKHIRLYSFSFIPYIHLFQGSTQLYLIYLSVFAMAIIAASQQVVTHSNKTDKMKAELDNFNLNERYNEMLDKKYHSNIYNADTSKLNNDKED